MNILQNKSNLQLLTSDNKGGSPWGASLKTINGANFEYDHLETRSSNNFNNDNNKCEWTGNTSCGNNDKVINNISK